MRGQSFSQRRHETCDECWAGLVALVVDAGMFGEKRLCAACYDQHYRPRPIVARIPATQGGMT